MPPDFHLFSALLGNCIWVSEGLVKLTSLLWIPAQTHITHPHLKIALSAWLIVLCWAFLSNCEAFSAQPGLWKEQKEAKWKLFQMRSTFCLQLLPRNSRKCPALPFSEENSWAPWAHNKPNQPGGFTGINYMVEVKYILRTKEMIDGFSAQKISAHLRFNHF